MKSRRLILVGSLLFIAVLLTSAAAACVSPRHKGEAVVQEYIEASILQDRDRALNCVHSSLAPKLFEEDDWVFSTALRGLLKDVDKFQLHFDPVEEGYIEDIPIVLIRCQVLWDSDEHYWALKFVLVEEQGEWKIYGWLQDLEHVRPD